MDLDQKTSKLAVLFAAINLLAATLGFAAVVLFGVFVGLMSFALLILVLPIGVQYLYLKKKSENREEMDS